MVQHLSSLEKQEKYYELRTKIQQHFERLEKDARQLSHINWMQLGESNISFFEEAMRA